MKPTQLFRTTVVIWTEYDPADVELADLAREADTGEGFCDHQVSERITDPNLFPDTDFFNTED